MAMKKKPAPSEEPPIQTERLPVLCPACGHREINALEKAGTAWRVTCRRPCGWSATYEIVPRSVLLKKGEFH